VAEIKNCTLNFAVRRPRFAGLTCAARKLAAAEIELHGSGMKCVTSIGGGR
jgi:hypothetical protein